MTQQATHHAKFDFDPTTLVVWVNSQFSTVLGVFFFLLFFLCFLRLAYKSHRLVNVFPAKDVSFGGYYI